MTTYLDVLKTQLKALEVEFDYMCDSDLYDDRDTDRLLDLIAEKKAQINSFEESEEN